MSEEKKYTTQLRKCSASPLITDARELVRYWSLIGNATPVQVTTDDALSYIEHVKLVHDQDGKPLIEVHLRNNHANQAYTVYIDPQEDDGEDFAGFTPHGQPHPSRGDIIATLKPGTDLELFAVRLHAIATRLNYAARHAGPCRAYLKELMQTKNMRNLLVLVWGQPMQPFEEYNANNKPRRAAPGDVGPAARRYKKMFNRNDEKEMYRGRHATNNKPATGLQPPSDDEDEDAGDDE